MGMGKGNGKVRLGFVGAGWWATVNHMPLLQRRDDVELVAVGASFTGLTVIDTAPLG